MTKKQKEAIFAKTDRPHSILRYLGLKKEKETEDNRMQEIHGSNSELKDWFNLITKTCFIIFFSKLF